MTINLLNLLEFSSIRNDIGGNFSGGTFVGGNNKCKTNLSSNLLSTENRSMDNNKFIEELRTLMRSYLKTEGDIIAFSKAIDRPVEQIKDFIYDASASADLIERIMNSDSCIKMGDEVRGDKIVFKSGGTINKAYGDSSLQEKIKRLELENSDMKKLLKEKDKIIDSKDDIIEILKKK